jgi:hypothetical protein
MISPHDTSLFLHTNDAAAARDEIVRFYRNYHSQRYVEGKLVIRMHHGPDTRQLASLNAEFADIVVSGSIESVAATAHEVRDGDHTELARIMFHFNRRDIGKLRRLVDRLNGWPDES